MIKHISFDVWNTLITANPEYAKARTKIISNVAQVSLSEAEACYKTAKKILDKNAEQGVCEDVIEAWRLLSAWLGLPDSYGDIMRYYAEIEFLHYRPTFNSELAKELCELSQDFSLSIKSNTNFISGAVLKKACEFEELDCFDFMHFSDEFLLCKPDPLFFAKTLLAQDDDDCCFGEILHVGDNLICDGKCVDVGMQFCYVSSPEDLLNKLKNGNLLMEVY